MAYPEDDENLLKFGNPKLPSEDEYYQQIHSPDIYASNLPSRKPASLNVEEPPADDEELGQLPPKQGFEEDIGPEVDASEEIARESLSPSPPVGPQNTSPRQNKQLDKYQEFMNQYKALQDQRQRGNLVAGLMQAGGQIGQSIAGRSSGNFKPDESGIQTMKEMANRPVTDFEQAQVVKSRGITLKDEEEARNPSSKMSEVYRKYAKDRLKMDLDDNVSAWDITNLLKSVGKGSSSGPKFSQLPVVNQKTGAKMMAIFDPSTGKFKDSDGTELNAKEWVRDYRAQSFIDPKTQERVGFNAGTGKVVGNLTGPGVNAPISPENSNDLSADNVEPIQVNRSFLNAQQAKQLDHSRDKLVQEVKDDRNSLNANNRVIEVLKAGGELGDLPREIQDQLNRAFGQKGHISDAQLGGLLGKADWKNRVFNAVSLGATGKLTDENRQFLLDVAELIKRENEKYIANKSRVYSNNLFNDFKSAPNLSKYKFGPEAMDNLLGVNEMVSPSQEQEDPKIQEYAKAHFNGDYGKAKAVLMQRGYKPLGDKNSANSVQSNEDTPAVESNEEE